MSEIHGATGAYAANALDPSELDEFEEHLAGCATCRREVGEFCETATELTRLSAAVPPPALKSSVMAAIRQVRVLPPEVAGPSEPEQSAPEAPENPAHRAASVVPVDELALRRQRRVTRLLALAVAAVMVVALGLGGWVVSLLQRQPPVASATAETELLRAPDLKVYTVTLKGGGKATFVASKSVNRAMISSDDLPVLSAGQTYQLWTLAGPLTAPTRVSPDALLSGGKGVKQWFTGPIKESDGLGISIEQAGGSSAPTDVRASTAF
ncbi:MAG: anti-sigma factor domain-containing protein [Propionicimonas sp.]